MLHKCPDQQMAIGLCGSKARCKAVTYRAGMIGILQRAAPAMIEPLIAEKPRAVFLAAAEIPMGWLGQELRQGFPFDVDEFLSRVREAPNLRTRT